MKLSIYRRFKELEGMPISVTEIPYGATGVHESCLRAYHALNLVQSMLHAGIPADVIEQAIEDIRNMGRE